MKSPTNLMPKEYAVRYGRNYKVVLAIVLPCLLIVPFILVLKEYRFLEEWKVWLIVFAFLGVIIALTMWLVLNVYPKAKLGIGNTEISLTFGRAYFPGRSDFSVQLSDIRSITRREIGGDDYFLVETRNPFRKFQISPSSASFEDLMSFDHAMSEISALVNKHDEAN